MGVPAAAIPEILEVMEVLVVAVVAELVQLHQQERVVVTEPMTCIKALRRTPRWMMWLTTLTLSCVTPLHHLRSRT